MKYLCVVKKTIALILSVLIAVQPIYAASVTAWFFVNQKRIADKYCENKDKPMLHCNGKCYLVKQLKMEQEQKSQPIPEGITYSKDAPAASFHYFPSSIKPAAVTVSAKITVQNSNAYSYLLIRDIFHPPGH